MLDSAFSVYLSFRAYGRYGHIKGMTELELLILLPLLLLAGLFSGDDGPDAEPAPGPNGEPLTAGATAGDDTLIGTFGADLIATGAGMDDITGGAGNDTLRSGSGDDVVSSGPGDDNLFLGDGDDETFLLFTEQGFTRLFDEGGDDTIRGEGGNDTLFDRFGSDEMYGGAGNDTLASYDDGASPSDRDTLFGGEGDDRLFGDDGDRLYGGAGDDTFELQLAVDDRGDQWVRIYDFDPTVETIEVQMQYGPNPPVVSFAPDPNGGTRLLIGGTNYAVIEGIPPENLTLANVNAFRVF